MLGLAVFCGPPAAWADVPAAPRERPASSLAAGPTPEPLVLDTKPEPFVPLRPRTEADQDRIEAMALFSTGRLLEQQQHDAQALRCYQRALRFDPQAAAIARAIIPLAIRLDRHAEAVRYALKLVDLEQTDPLLLQRLGVYLTETGDYARAALLYQRALDARKASERTPAETLLRMEMGRLYYLQAKHEQAAEQFALVLDALTGPDPLPLDGALKKALLGEAGATYALIGESFLLAGRLKEALAAFEKSHQVAPNKGLLGFNLARVALRQKQPDKALAHVQAYFDQRLASEGFAPYRLLAEILKAMGKEGELISRLEKLRAADPANAPLGYFLAGEYRDAGQLDKAEPLYAALVARSPTLTGYRSLVALYHQTGRTEALLSVLAQAVPKTASLEALGAEGKAVLADASLVARLIETARNQHRADPAKFDYDRRLAAAILAMDAKQYEAAGEFFDLAIQAKPDRAAELLLTWGLGLLMDEKYAPAARVFQQAIDQNVQAKDEAVFHFYLASALEMDGRTDQAVAAARKAAESKKDVPRFAARVGWVLYHANRHDEARHVYTELLQKHASDYHSAEVRQVLREARLVLSHLCVLAHNLAEAEEWLEQVLDEFPDDPSALNDLGYLWADANKRLGRAESMIRKALEAEPDNAAYRDSLGWVLYRQGRLPEAIVELEKSAAKDPDPVVLEHLGDAYAAAKQPEKASAAWQRAVEAFRQQGKSDQAKQVEAKLNRKR